ncbi:MAG: aminotransferase class V-fold PLP-dependent enzyme [Anaerolineae bacterium]
MSAALKSHYLLDPDVIFLNHGSFGACPRPVLEACQEYQRELERLPTRFLGGRARDLLDASRAALAEFVGVGANDIVYFTNPTTAINVVARSLADEYSARNGHDAGLRPPLRLKPGDEILTTDHEYGAMERTWRYVCYRTGARLVPRAIPLPVTTQADFVEHFWAGVTKHTRVIFISHITSPSALIFPVAEICRRARAAGILTVVDGAHAIGQIPLNLAELSADIYTGACHKWLSSPKGCAFLYTRPEVQSWLEPLVVSFGWESDHPGPSRYVDWHQWQGTRDLSPFLAVPAALAFRREHDWDAVQRRCHLMAIETRRRIHALSGLPTICPDPQPPAAGEAVPRPDAWFCQMFSAILPAVDAGLLSRRLWDEYRIEVPVGPWKDQVRMRVSFQAYNDQADADALVEALARLLPEVAQGN